jgi:bacteriocin biosynthesis cyclodehydratase domain-containing protein
VGRCLMSIQQDVDFMSPHQIRSLDVCSDTSIYMIAAGRVQPTLFAAIENLSYKCKVPFIPLYFDSTWLRIGPAIVPGAGPCWSCWTLRSSQHSKTTPYRHALYRYYEQAEATDAPLYLDPFILLGAAKLALMKQEYSDGTLVPGKLWQIDVTTLKTDTCQLIGVHGCPRCGSRGNEQTRSIRHLTTALASSLVFPVT